VWGWLGTCNWGDWAEMHVAAGLPTDESMVEAGDLTREGGARMRFLLAKRPGSTPSSPPPT
jgi:hypothetical protein